MAHQGHRAPPSLCSAEASGIYQGGVERCWLAAAGDTASHLPRKLKCWWHKHKLLSTKKAGKEGESVLVEQAPWVMDHQLLVFEGLFDEYLEIGRNQPWGGEG